MSTRSIEPLNDEKVPWETEGLQDSVTAMGEKSIAQAPAPQMADGGTRAWLQVIGSFLVFFNIWGFTFAFGSFQSFYELQYLSQTSPSAISWIGTVQSFLLIVIGVFSGPLFDLGYFRTMLFVGAVMNCIGVMMLSLSTMYYQIFLSQAICMGLGSGMLYLPGLALVGRSFVKLRAIAMGVVTCGAPLGGIIYTLIFEQCIGTMGYGWTVRVMGFVMLGSFLISFPLLLWGASNLGDLSSGTARKLFDRTAFKDLAFWNYSIANFFNFWGYLVPFFYIGSYGQVELSMSRSLSLYTLMIAQGSSIVGRVICSTAAHHYGVMIVWITCVTCSGTLSLIWIGTKNVGGFIAYAALYGGFSGALIPLPPSIFPVVCPDPKVLGTRLGMAQAIGSIASLTGSPIAGALATINKNGSKPNYLGLQLFSGLSMLFGACLLGSLWIILVKTKQAKILI